MKYESEFIDQLLRAVNLSDFMRDHGVQVSYRSGKNDFFISDWCCNKTDYDNGRINKEKQLYGCRVCGQTGNAINFLRNRYNYSFDQAIRALADYTNTEMPNEDPNEIQLRKRKYLALRLAANFYAQFDHPYLPSRGIAKKVLKRVRAGYAPGGKVLREYLEGKGFSEKELLDFSLINMRGLDTFFNRAIIPIFRNGKIVDLYGRSTEDAKLKHLYLYGGKFLNGIDRVDPNKMVYMYEAAIDRLVAESNGLSNGVDPGGAKKFSICHARMLKAKGVTSIAILYDGDKAGLEGAEVAGGFLAKENIKVIIVELPEETDPADIISQHGLNGLLPYTRNAKPYETFKAFRTLDEIPLEVIQVYIEKEEKRRKRK